MWHGGLDFMITQVGSNLSFGSVGSTPIARVFLGVTDFAGSLVGGMAAGSRRQAVGGRRLAVGVGR